MERDEEWKDLVKTEEISTHTLTWSVTCKDDTVRIAGENFNSHAHVERDNVALKNSATGAISTHTLTWSVTGMFGNQI